MPIYPLSAQATELDTDPRELERFAEHFKQRRIKLGVTQADVGKALAHLKMPGVGSLSQSTICRFESLTLSHNNMVALKPILHSWLEKAEEVTKTKDMAGDAQGILPNMDKKRKRTSIAAPEKRLLEDYFRILYIQIAVLYIIVIVQLQYRTPIHHQFCRCRNQNVSTPRMVGANIKCSPFSSGYFD
ncbi:unnamed protein product [Brugia timori]|uniref:POU-specific domain-containing protein n=1 Tax=Brugia timori TaxID=42155 RepID=A0A0R3QNP2_9BILA|nr:unnamed protein product [Brugia timori]